MENREAVIVNKKHRLTIPQLKLAESFAEIAQELEEVDRYLSDYFSKDEEPIKNSFNYLLNAGGKRIRPAFVLLASRFGERGQGIPAAAAIELVHMVSLIHDDVIDEAELRRGKATIHTLTGNKFSVHLGDYLFAQALAIIDGYQHPELSAKLAYASMEMCRGEIRQFSRRKHTRQNIRDYLTLTRRKTAALIRVSCEAGALVSGAKPEIVNLLGKYGYNLGMAYQINDDILDCLADEKVLGKSVCNDMKNGVLTLPLLYLLKMADTTGSDAVKTILRRETISNEEYAIIKNLLFETQALYYSQRLANRYALRAMRLLEKLPDNMINKAFRQIAGTFCICNEEAM